MSRINMVMFQGKIYKVTEKPTKSGDLIVEIRMRQSYPKVKGRKLDNPDKDDFHTDWIDVVCFKDTAKIALELQPNQYICVQGRLRYEEWIDKQTGKKRNKHVIHASYLHRTPGEYKDTVSNTLPSNVEDSFPAAETAADEVPF